MSIRKGKLLIVDDDDYIKLTLKMFLEQHFSDIIALEDPSKIPEMMENINFDVMILDMNFEQGETSGQAGFDWLEKILKIDPQSHVIMITAYGGVSIAVEAIKRGAKDFIVKPWQNERLLATISTVFNLSKEKQNVRHLKSQQKIISSSIDDQFSNIVGKSPSIKKVFNTIDKVAATNADVLLLGDNGTGKELVARSIHRNSKRSGEVFISVDLGSISETLFESELFGHRKGAFTDAKEDRIGRFEAASGGTVFLDEIGNLSLSLQAKLLAVIQNRKITRVGTNEPIDIDVRIIYATNRPLTQMVKNGEFREDLLYRINTVELQVPKLKERIDDIPLLTDHFLDLYSKKYNKPRSKIPGNVINKLKSYSWPGNIRELQHAVERAVIMSDSEKLEISDFSFLNAVSDSALEPENYNLEVLESWAIRKAMRKHHGNISHAAKELGLSRGAMYRRMEKYGL